MFVDVSSVIVWALDQDVIILRSQGRTFDEETGYYTELKPLSIPRRVHVQPVTGRDMDKLRELHDATEAVRVWSTESFELGKESQVPFRYGVSVYDETGIGYGVGEYGNLYSQSVDPNQKADQMIFRKKLWEIRPILNWEPGAYHEVVATL